jgi:cytoskeletal protein CcmA (bactofilin family)
MSYLGPGLQIKGEISGNEDLKLDGRVKGLVSIGGFRLTVGPSAHLSADIVAREAVIFGEVIGDINSRDRIEIMKSASIVGNMTTAKMMIEEGAYLKADVEIGGQNAKVGTDSDTLLGSAKKSGDK